MLARLSLNESDAEKYSKDLSCIMEYINKLESVDVSEIQPLTHIHGDKNIYREDVVSKSMPVEDFLQNAPDTNGQFFRVPIIKDHNVDN